MSESRPPYVQDYNHNDIEQDAISVRDPEAVRGNGRGIRRSHPGDSLMVDQHPVKRPRLANESLDESVEAHTADKNHITDEARTADIARIVDDACTADKAPTVDKDHIADEVLASIPLWMRNNVVQRYRYKDNRTLQPIIEVYLDYHSDEDNYSDKAIDSSSDINMLDTDDGNAIEANEAMEEDNYASDSSGVSSLLE